MNRGVMKMKDSQKRFHSRSVCLHSFFLLSLSLSFTDLFLSLSRRAERKQKLISAVGKLNPEESSSPLCISTSVVVGCAPRFLRGIMSVERLVLRPLLCSPLLSDRFPVRPLSLVFLLSTFKRSVPSIHSTNNKGLN
jgi:hypothetical protein